MVIEKKKSVNEINMEDLLETVRGKGRVGYEGKE